MKKSLLLLFLIFVVALAAYSQRVLKDIAQGTDNARIFAPGSFVSGDTLFFSADTVSNSGNSLVYYLTNGTTTSTKKLIPDIQLKNALFGQTSHFYRFKNEVYGVNEGVLFKIRNDSIKLVKNFGNSLLVDFFELNNQLHLLVFKSSSKIYEFWRTNGSESSTNLFKSLQAPINFWFSTTSSFTLNNRYNYCGYSDEGFFKVISDGTSNGTSLIQNTRFIPFSQLTINNHLYYTLQSTGEFWHSTKLWKSQGDSASAVQILDSIDGDTTYGVSALSKINNNIYFISHANGSQRISKLDTMTHSVSHVSNPLSPLYYLSFQNQKFYYAVLRDNFLDFYENSGSLESHKFLFSVPYQNSTQYFLYNGNNNYYLYQQKVTDGKPDGDSIYWAFNGTSLKKITDLVPGLVLGVNNAIDAVGDIFYFSASDSNHGYELWRTDGTASGTYMLKDLNKKPASSFPKILFPIGNYIYFMANDISHGYELWRTNGTITNLYADMNGINSYTHVLGSEYHFSVKFKDSYIADINYSFFKFTPDGNMTSLQSLPIYTFSIPHEFKDSLYFMGTDGNLWKTDGTISDTKKAIHLDSTGNGTGYRGIADLTTVNNLLFFTTNNGSILWRTDGKKSGTLKLHQFGPEDLAVINQLRHIYTWSTGKTLFFERDDSSLGHELWASNGLSSGTIKLPIGSNFMILGNFNNKLYFIYESKLWVSNGTLAGTLQIDNRFFVKGAQLRDKFYLIRYSENGMEYYELDKNNTITHLKTIPDFIDNYGTSGFFIIDDRYLLNCVFSGDEQHFYITDGNKENFKKAFTLKKSFPYNGDYDFLYHNKKIYFTAVDSLKGQELWVWDFDCPDGYTIRDNISKDSTIVYGKNIWGQSMVSNNKTVTYDAKNSITLQPGFEAQRGTVFKTRLIGCANTNIPNGVDDNTPTKNEPLVKVKSSSTYPQLMDFLYYLPNKHLKKIYERAQQTKLAPVSWDIVTEKDIYRLDLKIGATVLKGFLPKKK